MSEIKTADFDWEGERSILHQILRFLSASPDRWESAGSMLHKIPDSTTTLLKINLGNCLASGYVEGDRIKWSWENQKGFLPQVYRLTEKGSRVLAKLNDPGKGEQMKLWTQ